MHTVEGSAGPGSTPRGHGFQPVPGGQDGEPRKTASGELVSRCHRA